MLLSKERGKPVRVQWMRDDDMKWSTQSAAAYADVTSAWMNTAALQPTRSITPTCDADDRLIGAVLAGLPTMSAPSGEGRPDQQHCQRQF